MKIRKDFKWERYWDLVVLRYCEPKKCNRWLNIVIVECVCDCWKKREWRMSSLRTWKTKTCWCYNINKLTTHWMSTTRWGKIWAGFKSRCDDENHTSYKHYWWRWITYDQKWKTLEWFWGDMEEWYSDDLTLDRIDNNWNYCKENCRRATRKEQARNTRRNVMYKWKCIAEWCEELSLPRWKYDYRRRLWKPIYECLWLSEDKVFQLDSQD